MPEIKKPATTGGKHNRWGTKELVKC